MAAGKIDDDLDLGIEKGKGSKKKLLIMVAAAVVALLLSGLGAAWWLLGDGDQGGEEFASADEGQQAEEKNPAIYLPMDPLFIVNLPPGSKAKLLQVGIQVMARDQALIDFVQHNDPMIRNSLLNLLGTQSDEALQSRAGKEKLQKEVVKSMNKIVKSQGGPGEIEAVYFTTFVMQ